MGCSKLFRSQHPKFYGCNPYFSGSWYPTLYIFDFTIVAHLDRKILPLPRHPPNQCWYVRYLNKSAGFIVECLTSIGSRWAQSNLYFSVLVSKIHGATLGGIACPEQQWQLGCVVNDCKVSQSTFTRNPSSWICASALTLANSASTSFDLDPASAWMEKLALFKFQRLMLKIEKLRY